MTDHQTEPVFVTPADQRRAAELTEACLSSNGEALGDGLAALLDLDPVRTLAVTAVLARNLAAALLAAHGRDTALRIIESTRLDAAMHE